MLTNETGVNYKSWRWCFTTGELFKKIKMKGKMEMNTQEKNNHSRAITVSDTHVPYNNDNFNNKLDVLLTASPLNPSPHCPSVCIHGIGFSTASLFYKHTRERARAKLEHKSRFGRHM